MRVYLSSTFEDLEVHRAAAARAISRAGHQVVQMEYYVAGDVAPLDRVVDDVRSCDAFVGLYAWKRGSIPSAEFNADPPAVGDDDWPVLGESSFTEWELAAAKEDRAIAKLLFVLTDGAPWPPNHIEGLSDARIHGQVLAMRRRLRGERLVSQFRTPEDLESSVASALAAAETTRQLRVFRVSPMQMSTEGQWTSTSIDAITEQLQDMMSRLSGNPRQRTIKISLTTGWWTTRLFLLAYLCERLTRIRRILITETTGRGEEFVGLVPTDTAVSVLLRMHQELEKFVSRASARSAALVSLERESAGYVDDFRSTFTKARPEHEVKFSVTAQDLGRWFGHAMLTRTLPIRDMDHPTPLELAMVMNHPHDFVPIELPRDYRPDVDDEDPKAASREVPQRFQIVEQADLSAQIARVYVNDQLGRRG